MSRLLGVDLGAKRIGLAVGDEATGSAHGLGILRRGSLEHDAAALAGIAAERSIEALVVGLPRDTDGTEGPQAAATREWGEAIAARLGLPLRWRDERWTSQDAEAALGRVRRGRSGGPPSGPALRRRRAAVDREAARLILEAELAARTATGGLASPTHAAGRDLAGRPRP
ncbi:MAG TPA: Holliday junction resolvase RuvX [Candidatus Limnocylindrales bacterium]|nr:Holliday junction resolvase RuvX [Candidatus Limnocylindrales bacterium]